MTENTKGLMNQSSSKLHGDDAVSHVISLLETESPTTSVGLSNSSSLLFTTTFLLSFFFHVLNFSHHYSVYP